MSLEIEQIGTEDFQKTSVLQQSSLWSRVKAYQGLIPLGFSIRDGDCGNRKDAGKREDLLVLLQQLDDGCSAAYVPYGPKTRPKEGEEGLFLEELSEQLRSRLPSGCSFIRFDLPWESPWAHEDNCYAEDGSWLGPPPPRNQELRVNFPTELWNLRKTDTNILPTNTLFLDLTLSEESLLLGMHRKTRYNIRLSRRHGVMVREGDRKDLPLWYDLYRETCRRNRLFLHDISFFRDLFTADTIDSGNSVTLLLAEERGRNGTEDPLAALFLAGSGDRATYLYGASSSKKRNLMATYALQWEAIRRAKTAGYKEYDMFGVSPNGNPSHPLYGLYRFKRGFGGDMFHRMGCWDYPLDSEGWELFLTAEMNSRGYHL